MKVLVTGAKGQLGYDVVKQLNKQNIDCLGVDIDDFDLTEEAQVDKCISQYNPDVIVHCAAFTAVDRAEEDKELCYKVNVLGTKNIVNTAKKLDAKLIYISTDYVFEGNGEAFYEPEHKKNPQSYYGLTKSLGEDEVTSALNKYFIVRISWVFGINGNNFVKTMLKLGKDREELNVVSDQIGSPTYTFDLAYLLVEMAKTEKYGIYHATNEGVCSWADFAKEIMLLGNRNCKINYITSDQYPQKAKRPKNSRMSKEKLTENGFMLLPSWQDALKRYIEELKEQGAL
ncbi:MAG: dTDP-4-dehydrorhamnose reductase [Clostridiales bacterium]|nr:dTDP-4-dehydrorhamnose reductase [Clostridiales bacterium]